MEIHGSSTNIISSTKILNSKKKKKNQVYNKYNKSYKKNKPSSAITQTQTWTCILWSCTSSALAHYTAVSPLRYHPKRIHARPISHFLLVNTYNTIYSLYTYNIYIHKQRERERYQGNEKYASTQYSRFRWEKSSTLLIRHRNIRFAIHTYTLF